MYRDPMLVLEAKQEAEQRERQRQALKDEPSAARRAAEALFDLPPRLDCIA
ncbi:FAM114 family protein [Burkholderia cenocepacia]|uniref:FAM114 family protein n=1 Tax=Burkholderia cenocepacia TaxID=95486 RepID=UPI001FC8756A|nr:FAM114 family protein [Burkholderia cenocepacia]